MAQLEDDLFQAVKDGRIETVKALIEQGGINLNQGNDADHGYTALHYAANDGNLEIVKQLTTAGANVNAQNKWETTPLHLATFYQHEKVVRHLLEAPSIDIDIKSKAGDNALRMARMNKVTAGYNNAKVDPNSPCMKILDLLESHNSAKPLNKIINSLIKTVNDFHPTPWYEIFFRWIQDLFAPVRKIKDSVRDALNKQLESVRDNTPDKEKLAKLEALIDKFTKIQQYIEVERKEEVEVGGQKYGVVKDAQAYLEGEEHVIQFAQLDKDKNKNHPGVIKEQERHDVLIDKIGEFKPSPKKQ